MSSSKIPYLAGALVGLLLTITTAMLHEYFAPVSVYPKIGSLLAHVSGHHEIINKLKFFTASHGSNSYHQLFGFQTFFITGILLGAFFASLFSRNFKFTVEVPHLFYRRFGDKKKLRFLLAFIGGFIMSIGAMIASGCNIFYGISAFARFDASGIITFTTFYFGGVIINWFIYRGVK